MVLSNLPQREEYLKKKRNRRLVKFGIVIFLIILTLGLLSFISHRPQIRISKVTLTGGVLVTESEVQSQTFSYLQGSYLWLFPRNNSFLYNKGGLKDRLEETFKRIDTVDLHLKDSQTLAVDITERKPFAIWCKNIPDGNVVMEDGSTGSIDCYFMDMNSTIFAPALQFSGDAYFKYYGQVGGDNPIGEQYISSTTEFTDISNFVTKVKELSIHPLYIVAKENNEFSMTLQGGGQIYFDLKEPLSQTALNLEALLQTSPLKVSNSGNLPIDYIDLRYGNKLFYKLK